MNNKAILLVEDNADDQSLALRALKIHDISDQVINAGDGAEALGHLRSDASELPALRLLDLKLPKVDGLEDWRRVRGERRARLLAVVVPATSKEEQDLLRSDDLGAYSCVRKPGAFGQFSEAVRHLGLYWLVLNGPPPQRGGAG